MGWVDEVNRIESVEDIGNEDKTEPANDKREEWGKREEGRKECMTEAMRKEGEQVFRWIEIEIE